MFWPAFFSKSIMNISILSQRNIILASLKKCQSWLWLCRYTETSWLFWRICLLYGFKMIQLVQLSTWLMYRILWGLVENKCIFLASLTAILIKLPTLPNLAFWCLKSWSHMRTYVTQLEAIREKPLDILIELAVFSFDTW